MKETMLVIPVGQKVEIGPEDSPISGVVTAITIYDAGRILYSITWWDGNTRNDKYLEAFEVRQVKKSELSQIGFTVPL